MGALLPQKVLIVEDAEPYAAIVEMALARVPGISTEWLRTAEEALGRLAADPVCALITDLHLPHMSGFELIERVRREPRFAAMPVVVISGDDAPGTPERVLRMGADAFFAKPCSPAEVRRRVEQLINAK